MLRFNSDVSKGLVSEAIVVTIQKSYWHIGTNFGNKGILNINLNQYSFQVDTVTAWPNKNVAQSAMLGLYYA